MSDPRYCRECGWHLPTRGHHDRCTACRGSDVTRKAEHAAKMERRRRIEQERRAREEVTR